MRLFPALAVCGFALCAPARAQDPPPAIRVADVRAIAGDWIVLRAETDGKIVRWKALDAGIRIAPPELALRDAKTALATSCRPGVYRVHAVTAKADVPSEIVEFRVTVEGDAPPPGPGPGPGPTPPPEPTDPIARRIREALAADPGTPAQKREWAAALAGFYAAMAKHVAADQTATVGDLLADYRNAIPAVLPADAIAGTRRLAGQEVAAIAGEDPERKIDQPLKTKLVDLFTRLASALSVEAKR
jgi:hypothetical protein